MISLVAELRYLAPAVPMSSEPSARYAPVIVSIAILITFAVLTAYRIHDMNETHWKVGLDSFAASAITAIIFSYLTLRSFVPKTTAKVDPDVQRTMDALAAARALPTPEDRRFALRLIHRRGYVRLGLIVSELPLFLILEPRVGVTFATIGSAAIVICSFFILDRRFAV